MKIITDSSSDLTPELIAHFGVDAVIPMKISIDGREYRDKVDLTNDQFYQELLPASKTLPKTSQTTAGVQPLPGRRAAGAAPLLRPERLLWYGLRGARGNGAQRYLCRR